MFNLMKDVRRFHKKFGHAICDHNPSPDVLAFRRALIREESNELREALANLQNEYTITNLREVAREASDLIYVAIGTCVAVGAPLVEAWEKVHMANMQKFPAKSPLEKPRKSA